MRHDTGQDGTGTGTGSPAKTVTSAIHNNDNNINNSCNGNGAETGRRKSLTGHSGEAMDIFS